MGIMACNFETLARRVGVEENVGKFAIEAVPRASCWLKGTVGCRSSSNTGSLTPSCAARTADSGTSSEFIWAGAEATTCTRVASFATTSAFWRKRRAESADETIRIPVASMGSRTTEVSRNRTPGWRRARPLDPRRPSSRSVLDLDSPGAGRVPPPDWLRSVVAMGSRQFSTGKAQSLTCGASGQLTGAVHDHYGAGLGGSSTPFRGEDPGPVSGPPPRPRFPPRQQPVTKAEDGPGSAPRG